MQLSSLDIDIVVYHKLSLQCILQKSLERWYFFALSTHSIFEHSFGFSKVSIGGQIVFITTAHLLNDRHGPFVVINLQKTGESAVIQNQSWFYLNTDVWNAPGGHDHHDSLDGDREREQSVGSRKISFS